MPKSAAEIVICALIKQVRLRLDEASAIANNAHAFAKQGKESRALKTLMDFEGLSHEAHDMFKAALAIKRHLLADQTE